MGPHGEFQAGVFFDVRAGASSQGGDAATFGLDLIPSLLKKERDGIMMCYVIFQTRAWQKTIVPQPEKATHDDIQSKSNNLPVEPDAAIQRWTPPDLVEKGQHVFVT